MMTTSKDVGHHLEPKMKPIALWNFMKKKCKMGFTGTGESCAKLELGQN